MNGSDLDNFISPWWRLADTLNVIEATLLVLGIEPQGVADDVERNSEANQPVGYRAVKAGILAGLKNKSLKGKLRHPEYTDSVGNWSQDESRYDLDTSIVEVESLITWLRSRGFSTGYFFSDDPQHHGLKDANHPTAPGTAKQKLAKWLRLHAADYGLTDDEGKPRETVIDQLATIANWATKGGAPKAESPEPTDNDLDSEIPF